jgi:hypothetical protein
VKKGPDGKRCIFYSVLPDIYFDKNSDRISPGVWNLVLPICTSSRDVRDIARRVHQEKDQITLVKDETRQP